MLHPRYVHVLSREHDVGMAVVLHLSDLHLLGTSSSEESIASLVDAIQEDRIRRDRRVGLVVITGDVFDDALVDIPVAVTRFQRLVTDIRYALAANVRMVVVPGNHDRRKGGLWGPNRYELFDALQRDAPEGVLIHGSREGQLAQLVSEDFHDLPAHLLAYDSSYVARGLISAGGTIRSDEILRIASQLPEDDRRPVVLLMHHHLVPTPVTDLDLVNTHSAHPLLSWSVKTILPRLVGNGGHEEFMMTALGSGTAISTLQTLGRPILVLHGHKHYAAARLLKSLDGEQGDLLIAGSGSSGGGTPWHPVASRLTARLWPSFNVVELSDESVLVEQISFPERRFRGTQLATTPLAAVTRTARGWDTRTAQALGPAWHPGPRLISNEATIEILTDGDADSAPRSSYRCKRRWTPSPASNVPHYYELVDLPPESELIGRAHVRQISGPETTNAKVTELEIPPLEEVVYEVRHAICNSFEERRRTHGQETSPYERVWHMNRYFSNETRLRVCNLGVRASEAFASILDLSRGTERALPLTRKGNGDVEVVAFDCPARSLLTIYWPADLPRSLSSTELSADPAKSVVRTHSLSV